MKKLIKLISLFLFIIPVYIIYSTKSIKYYYIDLGSNVGNYTYYNYIEDYLMKKDKLKYSRYYGNNDYLIDDLYKEIKLNNKLKRDLREANAVTLFVGNNDILYKRSQGKNDKEIVRDINKDFSTLLKEIRKYYKKVIYLIDINKYYKCIGIQDDKITYINTNSIKSSSYYNEYLIAKRILKTLEK